MRAIVVGAVGGTQVLLQALIRDQAWEVPLVVTLPPELHSRHSDIVDLAPLADEAGAEVHFTAAINDTETLEAIAAVPADYIFVVGWSQICGPRFLALKPGKVIGYHPAALPRLRGRAVIPWTILLEEPITAGSLFWVSEGTDDGHLLAQKFFHVAADATAAELYAQHMAALAEMLENVLAELASGREPRTVQDERYATWAARRTPDDGQIDWNCSSAEIDRLVRAVGRPYPGAFTYVDGRKLTIWHCSLEHGEGRHHAIAGQIVSRQNGALVVQTGQGLLKIDDWEIEQHTPPRQHAILGGRG